MDGKYFLVATGLPGLGMGIMIVDVQIPGWHRGEKDKRNVRCRMLAGPRCLR